MGYDISVWFLGIVSFAILLLTFERDSDIY
jgi:hypothetical protein